MSVAIFWIAIGTYYLMYSLSNRNISHYTVTLLKRKDNINFLRWKMEMLKAIDQRRKPECTELPFVRPQRRDHVVACVEHCVQCCSKIT